MYLLKEMIDIRKTTTKNYFIKKREPSIQYNCMEAPYVEVITYVKKR